MTSILIKHADVITLDASGTTLQDTEIAISDGVIMAMGAVLPGFQPDEVVDARRHIVMPGFFNVHTHSPMALFRGRGPAHTLDSWLDDRDWLAESGLTPDDVYWGAALAACELIRSGVVGYADQYFHMDRVAQVVVESGLRADLAWCTFGSEQGEIGADLAGVAAFVERWQGAGDGRVRTSLNPHSPDLCNPVFLARTAAVAARLGVGIHLHLADTRQKVEQSLALYDMTPTELLNRNGIFDVHTLAAHCIHVSETDRDILALKEVVAVYCPTYQSRFGLGPTPVAELRAAGVAVALGTERPTVSGRMDMLLEARLSALRQREAGQEQPVSAEHTALCMATQGGARALGFAMSGQIAAGHVADLIMFDRDNARLLGGSELTDLALYSAQSADISDVMVAGKWLMRKRQLLTLDEKTILREAQRRGARLMGRGRSAAVLQNNAAAL